MQGFLEVHIHVVPHGFTAAWVLNTQRTLSTMLHPECRLEHLSTQPRLLYVIVLGFFCQLDKLESRWKRKAS